MGCAAASSTSVPNPSAIDSTELFQMKFHGMGRNVMRAPMSSLRAPMISGCPLTVARAEVKLGSDGGGLVFVPDKVTIKAGESVTFVNNVGFPHNIVFDEEAVDTSKISKEDYLNAAGETAVIKFDKAGSYSY